MEEFSIEKKLHQFIRKYYLSRLIKGVLICLSLLLVAFLVVNFLEYFLWLSSLTRKTLFYGFILLSGIALLTLVLHPLLKIFRIGKTLSNRDAAKIIGKHFSNVQDKLLNIILLKENTNNFNNESKELIQASIQQKIDQIKLVPFSNAVKLSENKKYFPFLAPPLLILIIVLLVSPSIIVEGTTRLIKNDQFFEKQFPFEIKIKNKSLQIIEGESFVLELTTLGDVVPSNLTIVVGESEFLMTNNGKNSFSYEFESVRQDISFQIKFGNIISKNYLLNVVNKPIVNSIKVKLKYPSYLELADESFEGITDLSVPEGTMINWTIQSKYSDNIEFQIKDSKPIKFNDVAEYSYRAISSTTYSLTLSSKSSSIKDTLTYSIQVIPDMTPNVQMIEVIDSFNENLHLLYGDASDDYGLQRVRFLLNSSSDSIKGFREVYSWLPSKNEKRLFTFSKMLDFSKYFLAPGSTIEYYIEAIDIAGKVGKSELRRFSVPSAEELKISTDAKTKEVSQSLQEAMLESADLAKELKKANEKLMNKKEVSWEDKEEIKKLLNKQENLQKSIEKIEKDLNNNNKTKEQVYESSEELKDKHRKIEELMDKVLNDEMKELVKKMQEMLDQMDKQKAIQNVSELKNNEESLNKELSRILELFKRIELEQKLESTMQEIKNNIEKQKEISENQKQLSNNQLKSKQDSLSKDVGNIKEDLDKLEEISKETGDEPLDLGEEKQEIDKAIQDMKKASQDIEKNKTKDAKDAQKSAQDKLENSLESLASKAKKMSSEQAEEDIESMRHLLENLLKLSFNEETLMKDFEHIDINSPQFLLKSQQQQKIKSDAKMVEDSLYALASRVVQIQSIVTKEINSVNQRIDKSIKSLENRDISEARMHQQYIMTHINNLALLLSEAFEQMQQQMKNASQKQGNSSCNKPGSSKGSGKPSLPKLGEMQKQLSDQIKKMGEMLKSGSVPGDKSMSQKFAEMAKQQSALRQALEEINRTENKDGKLGNMGNVIDKMNQTETDLVNKRITQEMISRQEEISVKLLDFDKAQKQRGEEEEREAKSAKDLVSSPPSELLDYLKKKKFEIEKYKTVPGSLKPFYKTLIDSYFLNLGK